MIKYHVFCFFSDSWYGTDMAKGKENFSQARKNLIRGHIPNILTEESFSGPDGSSCQDYVDRFGTRGSRC